jgi:hypothetical protein
MDLILIEKIEICGTDTYFYDGIDFDMIRDHKGEDGFLIFFVDSYISEVKGWERESRLNSILDGTDFEDFESEKYQNTHIAIYQTSGNLIPVYEAVKKKILETSNRVFPFKIRGSE